jgi:sterol desaturase/sphingolipid hydroxylase (fatty acid hydroxylase superfamily)
MLILGIGCWQFVTTKIGVGEGLALAYGMGILMLSYLGTVVLAQRLFKKSRQTPSAVSSAFSMILTVVSLGKIFVLGGVIYYGMIVLDLSGLYLVGGMVVGIGLITLTFLISHHFRGVTSQPRPV